MGARQPELGVWILATLVEILAMVYGVVCSSDVYDDEMF